MKRQTMVLDKVIKKPIVRINKRNIFEVLSFL